MSINHLFLFISPSLIFPPSPSPSSFPLLPPLKQTIVPQLLVQHLNHWATPSCATLPVLNLFVLPLPKFIIVC